MHTLHNEAEGEHNALTEINLNTQIGNDLNKLNKSHNAYDVGPNAQAGREQMSVEGSSNAQGTKNRVTAMTKVERSAIAVGDHNRVIFLSGNKNRGCTVGNYNTIHNHYYSPVHEKLLTAYLQLQIELREVRGELKQLQAEHYALLQVRAQDTAPHSAE